LNQIKLKLPNLYSLKCVKIQVSFIVKLIQKKMINIFTTYSKMVLFSIFMFFTGLAQADSPLTSTAFYTAYEEVEIVKMTIASNGDLTEPILKYLCNENKPIDVKMAVINALGTNFEGTNHSDVFLNYVFESNDFQDFEEFMLVGSPDLQLCYAYLLAMDNYFDVSVAAEIANMAAMSEAGMNSYTFQIIAAIINAQIAMDYDWCEVYALTDNVRQQSDLQKDLRTGAVSLIFEYMDLYGEDCP